MNIHELNKISKYLIKIVEENGLFFYNYRLICWEEALKQMEKNNDKDMENGHQSR